MIGRLFGWLGALCSGVLILGVRGYQLLLRPLLPAVCRFTPSCSEYFIAAGHERRLRRCPDYVCGSFLSEHLQGRLRSGQHPLMIDLRHSLCHASYEASAGIYTRR